MGGAEGRLVLVGGEAGVGKTALLRRFCEAPAWAGALALAEALGDTEARVYALTNVGAAEFRAGRAQGRGKLEPAQGGQARADRRRIAPRPGWVGRA